MDKGTLYLVATPIGNLKDMTFRAVEILKAVDIIAAEDTRNTIKLLNHFEIKNRLLSFHEYSTEERTAGILDMLEEGKNVALVSDAGTPLISDPGEELVRRAAEIGAEIVPIPGCCAAISALSASALNTDKFIFEGFLPKDKARKASLEKLAGNEYTGILYESPHQLKKTLIDLKETLGGDRRITAARELTKLHEQVIRTDIDGLIEYFNENEPRGEFVLVVEGKKGEENKTSDSMIVDELNQQLKLEVTNKKAILNTSKKLNVSKNRVYKIALNLKEKR